MGGVVKAVTTAASVVAFFTPGMQWLGYVAMGLTVVSAFIGDSNKKKSAESTPSDNKITLKSSVTPRKLAYGESMLSGPMALKTTTGSTKEFLHIVVSLAAHKVTDFLEVWYDDTLSSASRLSGYQRTTLHHGSILQTADSDLAAEVPEWTTAHRGRGIAYIYSRLKYNSTAWPNGVQNIRVVLRGKALYDPRRSVVDIASTNAGTPALLHTATAHGLAVEDEVFITGHGGLSKFYTVLSVPTATSLTLADQRSGEAVVLENDSTGGALSKLDWSNNAALAILDYMLWTDGLNASLFEIDVDYWIAAANACDEQVPLGAMATCTADPTSDVITLGQAVPWQTGLQVRITSTGTLPGGLVAGTSYAWVRLSPTTGYLASTKQNAIYELGVKISSAGSGTHTISAALDCTLTPDSESAKGSVQLADRVPRDDDDTEDADQDAISPQFGWATGDAVRFFEGVAPDGLAVGVTYYWIRLTNTSGQLAASHAAAIARTPLAISAAGSGLTMARVSQPRYTVNGQVDLGNKPIDNLEKLLTSCCGTMPYVSGKYRLHVAGAVEQSFELGPSDLRGDMTIQARPSKRDIFNAVRGTFLDPCQLWENSDLPPVISEQYQAEDGGEQIYKDTEFPFTSDSMRGQRLMWIILQEGRQGMTVEYPARLTAGAEGSTIGIAACDVGRLHFADELGWDGKLFRVGSWKFSDDMGIDMTMQEYSASAYDWTPDMAAHADYAPNTALASPWQVTAPTGLTLESGTDVLQLLGDGGIRSRLKVSWDMPSDSFVLSGGTIEVQHKGSLETAWNTVRVSGSDTVAYLIDVVDGEKYDVRIRSVNVLNAVSAWVEQLGHTIIGKSTPPPALTGLYRQGEAICWAYDNAPIDLAGYRVRVAGGITKNWLKGTDWPNEGAIVKERSIDATALGSGVTTVMVKPIDTSGNEADAAVSLTVNLGEYSPENLVSTVDLKAQGFPGTIIGGAVDASGKLISHDTGEAYLPDATAFYLPQLSAPYLPLTYGGMTYAFEYVPAADAVPGTAYLGLAVNGDGWTVSYRRRGTPDLYLGHDDEPYLPDNAAPYLGGPSPWAGYSGGVAVRREKLDFLIQTDSGNRQGAISKLTVNIDVEDIQESFEDLVILSTGTRVPITKTYRRIDQVGAITLQDDGHGATGIKIMDKDPVRGPLLVALGASQATIDIHNLKGH